MGMAENTRERGREQAGMTREGRRTMEKVLENTVRDTKGKNQKNQIQLLRENPDPLGVIVLSPTHTSKIDRNPPFDQSHTVTVQKRLEIKLSTATVLMLFESQHQVERRIICY